MASKRRTFVELAVAGELDNPEAALYEHIGEWHADPGREPLDQWLGFTSEEWASIVERPAQLMVVLRKKLAEFVAGPRRIDAARLRKLIRTATPGPLRINRYDNVSNINYQLQSEHGGTSEHQDYAVVANIRDDECPRAKLTAELITELYNHAEDFAALEDELAEVRAGYHALDRNWESVHNAAMGAIREALGMPDGAVHELCWRIRQLKKVET